MEISTTRSFVAKASETPDLARWTGFASFGQQATSNRQIDTHARHYNAIACLDGRSDQRCCDGRDRTPDRRTWQRVAVGHRGLRGVFREHCMFGSGIPHPGVAVVGREFRIEHTDHDHDRCSHDSKRTVDGGARLCRQAFGVISPPRSAATPRRVHTDRAGSAALRRARP